MKIDLSAAAIQAFTRPRARLSYWDEAHVFPRYDGWSVANLAASVAVWLGVQPGPEQLPPLQEASVFGSEFDHVVIVLIDGVGDAQLRWLRTVIPDNPYFRRIEDEGVETRLTSIVPSSTAAATTSIWTGVPAGRHGLIGYDTFLKQYGLVVNFLTYSPVSLVSKSGLIELTGKPAEEMIDAETMGEVLTRQGIASRSYLPIAISSSCLTRAQMRGSRVVPYRGFADLFASVYETMSAEAERRSLDFIYYNDIDTYNHLYGMTNERVRQGVDEFLADLDRLIARLRAGKIGRTLVLLTADHGHIPTTPDPSRDMKNQPELIDTLTLRPTGENRLTYFYPRAGKVEAFLREIAGRYPGEFSLVPSETFLADGFFGPPPYHPDVRNRIGEYIAIAHGNSFLWWNPRPDRLRSRHGGLSAEEMIVPFIGCRV